MIGELKDLNVESAVVDIPSTVNYNNKVISQEFDNIFNTSRGVLTKSVENKNGYVKLHHGEFVNLKVDNIVVKNVSALLNGFDEYGHENLTNRFSWNLNTTPSVKISDIEKYAHDTRMIVTAADEDNPISIGATTYTTQVSLRDELNTLENYVNALAKNITVKDSEDNVVDNELVHYSAGVLDVDDDTDASLGEPNIYDILLRLQRIEKRVMNIEYALNNKEFE